MHALNVDEASNAPNVDEASNNIYLLPVSEAFLYIVGYALYGVNSFVVFVSVFLYTTCLQFDLFLSRRKAHYGA